MMGFRDIFRLVPANEMAEMADSFTRNEILTSNEVRSILGMKPSDAPQADELRNKNMPLQESEEGITAPQTVDTSEYDQLFEETLAGIEKDIDSILGGVSDE